MSLNEILASGGALLLFLTLVQITPIKVNPWSAVGKIIGNGMRAIGKSMNKDVMDKLESVQKELKDLGEKHNKLERRMDKDDADECRTRILRFADELRRDSIRFWMMFRTTSVIAQSIRNIRTAKR